MVDSRERKSENFGFIAEFIVMMILDVVLG